VQNMHSFSCI